MSNVSFRLGTPGYAAGASAVDGSIYVSPEKQCIGLGTSTGIVTLAGPPAQTITVPNITTAFSYNLDSTVRSMGAGLFELVLLWKLSSSSSGPYNYYAQRQYFTMPSISPSGFTYYGGDTIPAQTLYYYNGASVTTASKSIETSVSMTGGSVSLSTSISLNYSSAYTNLTCCPYMILKKLKTDQYYKTNPAANLNPWGI